MEIRDDRLEPGERTTLRLRALYSENGYTPYRMSKFEEYDLYAGNKDFLVSDNVITFTDTDGSSGSDPKSLLCRECIPHCEGGRRLP